MLTCFNDTSCVEIERSLEEAVTAKQKSCLVQYRDYKKQLTQLREEAKVERIPVSQAIEVMKSYITEHSQGDALVIVLGTVLYGKEQNFELIRKFIVCSLTTFSDHAPLHFEFDSVQASTVNNRYNCIPENDVLTVIKWKDENKSEIHADIDNCVESFSENSCFDLSSDADIDNCVESFSENSCFDLSSDADICVKFLAVVATRHKSEHKNAKLNFDKPCMVFR
ncbi:unnamed protein product [Mytilus coruscus]|uniref:G protein gamma domain-containing protein n=1 Tax=Mytilus coruscus TaxID=42192 RepID=A0A6J8BV00_MYTCO|nr:unnamed protein product [Mytilus coruscus]